MTIEISPLFRLTINGIEVGALTQRELMSLRTACDRMIIPCGNGDGLLGEQIQSVIMTVCAYYGIHQKSLIKNKTKAQSLVWPRWVICRLLHDLGLSTNQIAKIVYQAGDHGSVLYALRSVETRCDQTKSFRTDLEILHEKVRALRLPATSTPETNGDQIIKLTPVKTYERA